MNSFDVDPFGSEAREILERENVTREMVRTQLGAEALEILDDHAALEVALDVPRGQADREAARYVVNTGDGREIVGLRLKEAIQLAGMSNGSWFKADGGPKHQPICYEATVCNCDVDFGRPLTALEMASRTS